MAFADLVGNIYLLAQSRAERTMRKFTVVAQRRVTFHCPVIHHAVGLPACLPVGFSANQSDRPSIRPKSNVQFLCCDFYSQCLAQLRDAIRADFKRMNFLRISTSHHTWEVHPSIFLPPFIVFRVFVDKQC